MKAATLLVTIIALSIGTTSAQSEDALAKQAREISDKYNECVYFSATNSISSFNQDISLAAEAAFQSCQSEQQQLAMFLRTLGASPQQIEETVLEKKTGIKRELRKLYLESRGIK